MSIKRLNLSAIGSSTSTINYNNSYTITYSSTDKNSHLGLQTMRPSANVHGNVNIMLGG